MSFYQEFLHYVLGTILVFIGSIVVAVKSGGIAALIAGSVSVRLRAFYLHKLFYLYLSLDARNSGEWTSVYLSLQIPKSDS